MSERLYSSVIHIFTVDTTTRQCCSCHYQLICRFLSKLIHRKCQTMVNNVYYKFKAQGDRIKLPTSKDYPFHIRQKKSSKRSQMWSSNWEMFGIFLEKLLEQLIDDQNVCPLMSPFINWWSFWKSNYKQCQTQDE